MDWFMVEEIGWHPFCNRYNKRHIMACIFTKTKRIKTAQPSMVVPLFSHGCHSLEPRQSTITNYRYPRNNIGDIFPKK